MWRVHLMHQNFRLDESAVCVAGHSVGDGGCHVRDGLGLFAQRVQILQRENNFERPNPSRLW